MASPDKKKKSPVIFIFAAFLAIVIVMFIAHQRSVLVWEIRFPLNNGIANLSTSGNFLVAVSMDKKMYIWDWSDLSKHALICGVESDQAALLKPDLIVSLRSGRSRALVVTSRQNGEKHKEIPFGSGSNAFLTVNRGHNTAVLTLVNNSTVYSAYELMTFNIDTQQLSPIVKISIEASNYKLTGRVVSDDGNLVALVGSKNNSAWMALVNIKQKQVVWEKELPQLKKLFKAAFSTNGRIIYARGSDSTLYKFETDSGKLLSRLLSVADNKSTADMPQVQAVAVSPDGNSVAGVIGGTVYVWDCETGKKIFTKWPIHKILSGVAFSPDSRFLATSDMRQSGTIKIWRMPED